MSTKFNANSGNLSLLAGGGAAQAAPSGKAAVGSWIGQGDEPGLRQCRNLYIAAYNDGVIDEIPANMNGLVVYAGQFLLGGSSGDGGTAANAKFSHPLSIATDAANNLYVADPGNFSIRMITPGGGTVSTVAGTTGQQCSAEANCGDGGPATSAMMGTPTGVFVDSNQNIYVVDALLDTVRVVYNGGAGLACLIALENPGTNPGQFTLPGNVTSCAGATPPTPSPMPTIGDIYLLAGSVSSAAGGCESMPCGDGQLASLYGQLFNPPGGIAVDAAGNIFVNDTGDLLCVRSTLKRESSLR